MQMYRTIDTPKEKSAFCASGNLCMMLLATMSFTRSSASDAFFCEIILYFGDVTDDFDRKRLETSQGQLLLQPR